MFKESSFTCLNYNEDLFLQNRTEQKWYYTYDNTAYTVQLTVFSTYKWSSHWGSFCIVQKILG